MAAGLFTGAIRGLLGRFGGQVAPRGEPGYASFLAQSGDDGFLTLSSGGWLSNEGNGVSVLTVGVAQKATGDRIRLACDFGNEQALIDGAAIASYTVTCVGTGHPLVTAEQLDYSYQVSAIFSGGSIGAFDCVFTITLNDADATVIQRTGTLKVL